jgi:alkaline phosphatase D
VTKRHTDGATDWARVARQLGLKPNAIQRRHFLGLVVAAATASCAGAASDDQEMDTASPDPGPMPDVPFPELTDDPFTLGVASGDPLDGSVILWTRLAPKPLEGGGMPTESAPVLWEIAADEAMTQVVQAGYVLAHPELAHSVHVDAQGLEPDTWYWYRFTAGDFVSPVGRTRTLPSPGTTVDELKIAAAACQAWKDGYYTAHHHLAQEDVDVVFFLGDYIYESGVGGAVRDHNSGTVFSLDEYRNRYGLYKGDLDLQAAHARFPWVVTWDDHEVANNYAGDVADQTSPIEFLSRRANAYQAYYEHMPIRVLPPDGPDLGLYRAFRYGDLATFYVLDGRQYRSDQPCGDKTGNPACDEMQDPAQQMLGEGQEAWLMNGLEKSQTVWNVLAQQTVMTNVDFGGAFLNFDQWDGYPVARQRLIDFLSENEIDNVVALTGDIHSYGVGHINKVVTDTNTPVIITEFVVSSITSTAYALNQLQDFIEFATATMPQVHFFDVTQRGYIRCTITPEAWRTELRSVETVQEPTSDIQTIASFEVDRAATDSGPVQIDDA